MRPTDDGYSAACKRAATDQGLDPLTAAVKARKHALEDAGVKYYVEQTGGFTMVSTFYVGELALTCTNEGSWIVCEQPVEVWTGDYDGDKITDHSESVDTPEQIVALALELARREQPRCGHNVPIHGQDCEQCDEGNRDADYMR